MVDDAPFILTAVLDDATQAVLDGLRRTHFPVERNHLAAHVTLFHTLPAEQHVAVEQALQEVTTGHPSFPVEVARVRSLGRGVAYDLDSPALVGLRADLADRFAASLSRQDRAGFRPHVTVQNKVSADAARTLLTTLSATFTPWSATAEGLALWRYRGGPWDPVRTFAFTATG